MIALSKKEKQEIILIENKVFGDGLATYKLSADGNWVMRLDSRTNKYKSYQNFDLFYDNILEKERLQYARENAKNVFEFLDNNGAELLNKSIDGASRYYLYKNNYIRVSNHWNQSEYKDKETGINKYKFIENNFYSYKKDGWKEMISEIESLNDNDIRYKKGGLIAPNGKPTLLKNVKVGQKFYMLNKNGTPKFNGNITFEMTSNNGKVFEYFRIENNRLFKRIKLTIF
jgi:hypothetical protein